jgi:hypothetical protein
MADSRKHRISDYLSSIFGSWAPQSKEIINGAKDALVITVVFKTTSPGKAQIDKMRSEIDRIFKRLKKAIQTIHAASGSNQKDLKLQAGFVFRAPSPGESGTLKFSLINGPHVHGLVYGPFRNEALRRGLANYLDAELPSFKQNNIRSIHIEPIIRGRRRGAHSFAEMPHEALLMADEDMFDFG